MLKDRYPLPAHARDHGCIPAAASLIPFAATRSFNRQARGKR
jgi:hypothetical protein